MRLSDLIRNHEKTTKIILANKVSVGNALIRQCNIVEGVNCFNIITKTPLGIATEIMNAVSEDPVHFLSPDASIYLMMNVLKAKNSEWFPESTLTLGTAREVLLRINEIRENGVTKEYENDKNSGKLQELDQILNAYEQELTDKRIYDKCRILREAAAFCRDHGNDVIKKVPYLKGAVYGDLSTNRWATVEKEFTDTLLQATGSKRETISFLADTITIPMSFYKARGITNEIRFAVQKMKEIAETESYGTIALYYSSPAYVNFLKAALDAEKIPYCVTSGNSTKELHLTHFFLSLLDSAEHDFSYELLEKVVRNKVITFDNVLNQEALHDDESDADEETGEDAGEMTEAEREEKISEQSDGLQEEKTRGDSVWVNPIRGYRKALSAGIGWGRDRYMTYCDGVEKDDKAEKNTKVFARFLRDYVEVFDNDLSIGEIYRKLWDFVQLYTYAKNPEKTVLNNTLQEKWNELMLIDSTGYPLEKKIAFIRDMLENMKVDDGTDKGEAVCIFPMRDLFVIERKHNFMLGLSASSFSTDDKQSPLLLDEEKCRYLKGAGEKNSPIELASKNYERLAENVKNSLRTSPPDADVTMSYSYYDSIALRDDSESVLFIELSKGKNIEQAPGYEEAPYIQMKDIRLSADNIKEAIMERADKIEEEREEKRKKREKEQGGAHGGKDVDKKDDMDKEPFSMSATGIQTLLQCPLQYYYQYVRNLRIDDQMTPKGHEWLDSKNKGNICHYTMENYMSDPAVDPAGGINMNLFEKAYEDALKDIEKQQPAYSDVVKDREIAFYKQKIQSYIEFLCRKWAEDKEQGKAWKVIGCELPFGKNDKDGRLKPVYRGKDYEIGLNGSIDRADGYMTPEGVLKLRIIDYKTGKKESKEEEIKHHTQIQHHLYAMALCDYLDSTAGKERIRSLFGRDYKEYVFEWVGYTFPYNEKEEDRLLNVLDPLHQLALSAEDDAKEAAKKAADADVAVEEDIAADEKSDKERIASLPESVTEQLDGVIGNLLTDKEDLVAEFMDHLIDTKREERKDEKDKTPGPKMLLKTFCDKNYCKYRNICRKWVGYTEQDPEEDDE